MLDNVLLESFLAVVEEGSFTMAAERLGLTQSSVSQQIRRLENQIGKRLFRRSTHQVLLLPDGERMLGHARRILDAIMEAERDFATSSVSGLVCLGVAEDFATSRLPDILRHFRRSYPDVTLQIEIGLSANLLRKLHAGEFDIVLAKTKVSPAGAESLMSDPLVWVMAPDEREIALQRPLALALHPEPSISREMVIESLERASIPFRIAHTSLSITGLRAGVLGGLGISVFGRGFVPDGLEIIDQSEVGLPELPALPFVLERQKGTQANVAVEALVRAIRENVSRLDHHRFPTN
ncbi:LysR family transcriptional regulator [Acetobacter conturbans]|uniref:LysR family transcriptional regulator n=1 Tax=Acetobacter conturbans TaxID=1737472 RepID=A0ABX0K266_9PROT|nr:LysR substrate-binding domain-containing protein [Acetobacter conturbans]NHN89756.1 LysR family transcriptional regulator [Acetobacter conturbans]